MNLCSKGCGRPAQVRGYCRGHYNGHRTKRVRCGVWQGPITAVGTRRRLQALVAIGYTQHDLCRISGLSPSSVSHLIRGNVRRTSPAKAELVAKLYDRLSMTPGGNRDAAARAKHLGWPPPLAWDDDSIDDPAAEPDFGERRSLRWDERYLELRDDLGLTDEQIASRLGVKLESLLVQRDRYGISA